MDTENLTHHIGLQQTAPQPTQQHPPPRTQRPQQQMQQQQPKFSTALEPISDNDGSHTSRSSYEPEIPYPERDTPGGRAERKRNRKKKDRRIPYDERSADSASGMSGLLTNFSCCSRIAENFYEPMSDFLILMI